MAPTHSCGVEAASHQAQDPCAVAVQCQLHDPPALWEKDWQAVGVELNPGAALAAMPSSAASNAQQRRQGGAVNGQGQGSHASEKAQGGAAKALGAHLEAKR